MATNLVDFSTAGYDMGSNLQQSIYDSLSGMSEAFSESGLGTQVLSALSVVAIAFLVIVGFWIVIRNLVRAANMTGRRR